MKKMILSLAALLLAGSMYAQTPEEKAAKKAAEKEASSQLSQGMKLRDEVVALYQANLEENKKGAKANQETITKNQAAIKEKSVQALDLLQKAMGSGYVAEKKYYDGYKAMDDVSAQLLNPELSLAAKHQTFDTITFAKSIDGVSDGCYGTLTYGKEKDEMQKVPVAQAKLKMPKLHTYYAYLTMFYIETKNLNCACEAFDKYKGFPTKYPTVANDPVVANPQTPYSQLAFNIYLTAYNAKKFDICSKYYEEAAKYDDAQSHNFVVSSLPQIALQRGDTAQWAAELKKMIAADPKSENAEIATQNLLAYYSKKGVKQMNSFADEMLATDPENKIANYGKGYALVSEHKYAEALKYYQKTVEIDPEYFDGNYQCGYCLYQIGLDNGRAIQGKKYTSQAAADKDKETKCLSYLRQALPYFEKAQSLKPDQPDRWANELSVIYSNLGQKAKAAEMKKLIGM